MLPTLNLLRPEHSGIAFQVFTFPDGQPHLKLTPDGPVAPHVRMVARISSPADLLWVLLGRDALELLGCERVDLDIAYLMAARMDRVMTPGEPFSLRVVAGILNGGGFHRIRIWDPHSDVATGVLHHASAVDNSGLVRDALAQTPGLAPDGYWLVSPDAGALKKTHKVAQTLGALRVAEGMKVRDVRTGQLSGFKTFETDFQGLPCYIVDDICDGGGTFAGLAALLQERNAGSIHLVVSHGIFSKGYDLPGIDRIYTTDSFRPHPDAPAHVRVREVEQYLG